MANDFSGDENCVALWSVENGALTTDSIGSNTLTDNNTVQSETSDYKEGSGCADFEYANSEYFNITDSNLDSDFPLKSGDTNKKISVCFWVKFESLFAYQYLFSKWDISGSDKSFAVVMLTDTINIRVGYNGGASDESLPFGTTVQTGRWYHVGATYDDSDKSYRLRIWDDTAGALLGSDATGNATNNIDINSADVCIGGRHGGSSLHDGLLDEVPVFDDILSTTEIDQIRAGTYSVAAGSTEVPIMMHHYTKNIGT